MPDSPRSIALVDCNNFYVSCERLFRPDLQNRPVLVLSNNDGCVVSRSNEAKALGVKMAVPVFQIADIVKRYNVAVFSSNYTLYADISNRVMSQLSRYAPLQEVYSIDETFLELTGFSDINERAVAMRHQVGQQIGIPVCVGIGPSKTLAKLANFVAKRHPKSTGVFNFNRLTPLQTDRLLHEIPINEIWGIGRQLTSSLNSLGIHSVAQLRDWDIASMRSRFGVVMEKTIRELGGYSCIDMEDAVPSKKQIINCRSFGRSVTDIADLQDALAHFVSNAAKKCRDQHSVAGMLQVFLQTNQFRRDQPQYCPSVVIPLTTPTSSSVALYRWALAGLKSIYQPGFHYKKAGVILSEIVDATYCQGDLFTSQNEKPALMKTMDALNSRFGKGTVRLSQDGSRPSWKMRRESKSPEYTTNWNELPVCR